MSRKTWASKNFRFHPDHLRKNTAAEGEKHREGIEAKVSFDSVSGCFEIKCKVAQDWDSFIMFLLKRCKTLPMMQKLSILLLKREYETPSSSASVFLQVTKTQMH